MRRLKSPENYSPPKEAAEFLRETADKIEAQGQWVNCYVNLWFATPAEVRLALINKGLPFQATLQDGEASSRSPEASADSIEKPSSSGSEGESG